MVKNETYRVKSESKFHAGRIGVFEFMGGPKANCVVLSDPKDRRIFFAVAPHEVEDYG